MADSSGALMAIPGTEQQAARPRRGRAGQQSTERRGVSEEAEGILVGEEFAIARERAFERGEVIEQDAGGVATRTERVGIVGGANAEGLARQGEGDGEGGESAK